MCGGGGGGGVYVCACVGVKMVIFLCYVIFRSLLGYMSGNRLTDLPTGVFNDLDKLRQL